MESQGWETREVTKALRASGAGTRTPREPQRPGERQESGSPSLSRSHGLCHVMEWTQPCQTRGGPSQGRGEEAMGERTIQGAKLNGILICGAIYRIPSHFVSLRT